MLKAASQRSRAPLRPPASLLALLLLLLAAAAPPRQAGAAEETATAVVEGVNAALLDAMRNAEALGFEGRRDRLAPVLTEAFDFPAMARVAAGGHWRGLDAAERARLSEAFTRRSVADFAARFDGYSGERFEVLGERPMRRGSVLVENQLVKPSGETVAINYVLRPVDDGDDAGAGWRIIDVFLDAKYSELARLRAEYSSVLEREGFERLIESLEEKTARLAAGTDA